MLKQFRADLHIHTCLSPCGDLKMTPQKIVQQAIDSNLDIIAICDHNSAENVTAVLKVAEGKNIKVLPGMEICSREEIHVAALFENIKQIFTMQSYVYENLHGENNPDVFGMQVVGNECDEVVGFNSRLLIGAVDAPIEKIVNQIHRLNGLAIASHIDRESYSVIVQLGFVPDDLKFDALEISLKSSLDSARQRFKEYYGYTFVQSSDAHLLDDIGKGVTELLLADPSFPEIVKAFRKEDGRKVIE